MTQVPPIVGRPIPLNAMMLKRAMIDERTRRRMRLEPQKPPKIICAAHFSNRPGDRVATQGRYCAGHAADPDFLDRQPL
jgi:hypothetical protein